MILVAVNEGINGSVVVAEDGRLLFALQEERVNRLKEYHGFPHQALDFALAQLGLDPREVGHVALSNHASPTLSREAFLAVYRRRASRDWEFGWPGVVRRCKQLAWSVTPRGLFGHQGKFQVAQRNRQVEKLVRDHGLVNAEIVRSHHQGNHAASAYFGCRADPVTPHLVLTLDGGGDDACAHVYLAEAGRLELLAATPVGHSVGNIYAATTQIMGMTPHEHEYKLMGLAAYANPEHSAPVAAIFSTYLDLDPADPLRFKRRIAEPTFEIQRRLVRDLECRRFDNLSGGLQAFTEELLCRWVQAAVRRTGVRKVVAAGGVFMNVKANGRIAALPEVEYFDVFPSCGDETLPFGEVWHFFATRQPERQAELTLDHLYLGPDGGFGLAQVLEQCAADPSLLVEELDDPNQRVAELLAAGEVVARCSGPMEFGARALGNRSILADPADPRVVPRINRMIKKRDFWMPFAPAVLFEHAADYLEIPASLPAARISPYMMHSFATTERRDELIAGVHQHDLSTRAQVVGREANPGFHDLICRFHARTGRPVVLNTSFNLHGWPIVLGAADAVGVLRDSGLTNLVVNDTLIRKI